MTTIKIEIKMSEQSQPYHPFNEEDAVTSFSGHIESESFGDNDQTTTGYEFDSSIETDNTVETVETQEIHELSMERIAEIIDSGHFAMTLSYAGKVNPLYSSDGRTGNSAGYMEFGDSPHLFDTRYPITPYVIEHNAGRKNLLKMFEEQGVSELVTVRRGKENYDKIDWESFDAKPHQDNGDDRLVEILYETVTKLDGMSSSRKFQYADIFGRLGNNINLRLYLPESKAKLLVAAIRENPAVIRSALDVVADKILPTTESWNGPKAARPNFEQWEQNNGGVSRIALRTTLSQEPDESEIIEFNV